MTASARSAAHVVAQAKINLFLRVLAREASGYHQLETLFQRLELGDDVMVRTDTSSRTLDCRGADVGPVERNLAWRAATAYADATGWPNGFAIEIEKRIPVGGGLGGGSADAGAVFRCLNALAPNALGAADLLSLAATLGSDVPFLTSTAPLALAWGRGERMLALQPLAARRAHLVLFDDGVSTAEAYGALASQRGERRVAPILWDRECFASWDDVALVATNDFEDVVLPTRADIAEMRDALVEVGRGLDGVSWPGETGAAGDLAPITLMSGSGATVFLLSPMAASLVVVGAPEPGADVPRLRIVETRTATRVAEVVVDG